MITMGKINTLEEMQAHFDALDNWACEKIRSNQEPTWVWYELYKLREAIERLRTNSIRINIPTEFKVIENVKSKDN